MVVVEDLAYKIGVGRQLFERAWLVELIAWWGRIGEDFLDDAVINTVFLAEKIEGWRNAVLRLQIVLSDRIPKLHAGIHSRSSGSP